MKTSIRLALAASLGGLALPSLSAQVVEYGAPSPAGFAARLHSAAQQSFAGNAYFRFHLEHANPLGAAVLSSLGSASLPVGQLTLLLDPLQITTVMLPLPPGSQDYPVPLLLGPLFQGVPMFFQSAVLDTGSPAGFGLSNGLEVTIAPVRTPLRAYIPGQDFSSGASAPGQLATLDLSSWPPFFRATASIGFAGNISTNYGAAVAVSDRQDYAFVLGHGSTNPIIRILALDPMAAGAGAVYPQVGDIPLSPTASGTIGRNDLEITRDGHWLFSTSGTNPAVLQVWDVSGLPATVPTAPAQTLTIANGSSSPAMLALSPDDQLLGLVLGGNSSRDLTIYDIVAPPQPLAQRAVLNFRNMSAAADPSSVAFSPDSRSLLVVGGGSFGFADLSTTPPSILADGATWSTSSGGSTVLGRLCGALAIGGGQLVGIVGENGASSTNLYAVIDLDNPASPSFATVVQRFSTNPGGNISNHRIHALGNIVVAIDGSGATADAEWVDVIDLDRFDPVTTFAAARVKMPSFTSLSPGGISCIPREFDLR